MSIDSPTLAGRLLAAACAARLGQRRRGSWDGTPPCRGTACRRRPAVFMEVECLVVVERLVAAAPRPAALAADPARHRALAGCRSRAPPRARWLPAGSPMRQDSVSRLYAMRAGKVASPEARIALARVTSNTRGHPAIVHGRRSCKSTPWRTLSSLRAERPRVTDHRPCQMVGRAPRLERGGLRSGRAG